MCHSRQDRRELQVSVDIPSWRRYHFRRQVSRKRKVTFRKSNQGWPIQKNQSQNGRRLPRNDVLGRFLTQKDQHLRNSEIVQSPVLCRQIFSVLCRQSHTPPPWFTTSHLLYGDVALLMVRSTTITSCFWTLRTRVIFRRGCRSPNEDNP